MLFWTIQITVISFILIFLVHYLINFFKSTLTVPKIKDLVNNPKQKYENMYNTIKINSSNSSNSNNSSNSIKKDYNLIDLLPNEEKNSSNNEDYTLIDSQSKKEASNIKDELKNFFKKQLHN